MARSRIIRAFAALALILAQAAPGLSHGVMGRAGSAPALGAGLPGHVVRGHAAMVAYAARGTAAASGHRDSRGGCSHGERPHPAPQPPCGSCPGSLPGGPMEGTCAAMSSCNSSAASPGALAPVAPATVVLTDLPATATAPPTHDFIPDPPPPRA